MNHFNWQNSVEQHQLGHGNTLYGIRDQQLPVIYFQIIFNYSAIFDPEHETGRAYILTHMLLKGNRKFPRDQLYRALDQIGGSLNLYATADYITITGKAHRDHFSGLIDILKKVLNQKPDFSEEELEIAKSRARDHLLTLRDNHGPLVNYIFLTNMFQRKYYGKILSGTRETLKEITIGSLQEGFNALRSSGMMVALAGDYQDRDVQLFKPLMVSGDGKQIDFPEIKCHHPEGLELYYYHKPQLSQTYTVMGQQGVRASEKEIYAMILFNKYFGSDFTSILPQEIREKHGWSYYIQSELSLYRHGALFSMEYAPNTDVTVESFLYLKNLFREHVEQIPRGSDLQFPVEKYINSLMFKFSTTLKRLNILVEHLIYGYPDRFYEIVQEKFQLLSPTILNNILNKVLFPDHQVVAMVGNIETLLPRFEEEQIFSKIECVNHSLDLIL